MLNVSKPPCEVRLKNWHLKNVPNKINTKFKDIPRTGTVLNQVRIL
jgi:hypothetical protein